jgi:hypothetical protein
VTSGWKGVGRLLDPVDRRSARWPSGQDPKGGRTRNPTNGTVDDRHGQELAREAERAGRLVDDAGGDVEEAEARFDEGDTAVGQRP